MTAAEIRELVASANLPDPPASASESLKRDCLTVRLLVEIACGLADLNAHLAKGDE